MRFCELIRTAGTGMPLILLVLSGDPVRAQFREIEPGDSTSAAIEIELAPTQQPFVAPEASLPVQTPEARSRSLAPAAAAQPTSATPLPQPTPAVQLAPVAQPVPAVQPVPAEVSPSPVAASDSATSRELPAPTTSPAPTTLSVPALASEPFLAFRRQVKSDGPAAPAPEAIAAPEPLSFNQVTPGQTTFAEIETLWGPAAKTIRDGSTQRLIYRAPGFLQVDLVRTDGADTVDSILVHLAEPLSAKTLEEHLQLSDLSPVEITDETGTVLGRGYPERGVLLSYQTNGDSQRVRDVALEPIRGELYRLRVEKDHRRRYTQNLADLEEAIRLNPQDAKAYWMQAELYVLIGRSQSAWNAITVAVRIAPDNPLYQLTHARLKAPNGALQEALAITRSIAADESAPSIVRARAEYQLGNLVASGSDPDFQEALNHHLKAIDLASKYLRTSHFEVRRMAKDILVDSHLAVAQDIALGHFQRQSEVVPKWLTRATELAEDFISEDAGDETMRMEIYRTTLAAYSVLEGGFDASIATEEAIHEGQRLIAEAEDRAYQFHVERELSETLYHAAKIEHRCGRLTEAMKYANNAVVLLEGGLDSTEPTRFDQIMRGQLYFFVGSMHALQDEDHSEAVKWYAKALPAFDEIDVAGVVDGSVFGDLFVSMGVSYWETGQRAQAIELTQAGAELMQQGVQSGIVEMAALVVPYGNLSAMHRELGNPDQAKHFATMMAKVEKDAESMRR